MPIQPLTLDERIAAAPEDVMEALLSVVSSGHPMKVCLANRTLDFNNGFTGPDDLLRFREHLPALKSFTFRLPVEQALYLFDAPDFQKFRGE